MNMQSRLVHTLLAAGMGIALALAGAASLADSPQAVVITTHLVFDPDTNGTFEATGPVCSTGTVSLVKAAFGEGPSAFNVNAVHKFTCDDNSGTFNIRLHPQYNGRPKDGFDANGPWSVWGKGTGAYRSLSGSGEIGVVLDDSSDPFRATETYVGFINLH